MPMTKLSLESWPAARQVFDALYPAHQKVYMILPHISTDGLKKCEMYLPITVTNHYHRPCLQSVLTVFSVLCLKGQDAERASLRMMSHPEGGPLIQITQFF